VHLRRLGLRRLPVSHTNMADCDLFNFWVRSPYCAPNLAIDSGHIPVHAEKRGRAGYDRSIRGTGSKAVDPHGPSGILKLTATNERGHVHVADGHGGNK
jgi:hypothetical protein